MDETNHKLCTNRWVREVEGKFLLFDLHGENDTYKQVRKYFIGMEYGAIISRPLVCDMLPLYEYLVPEEPVENGRTL